MQESSKGVVFQIRGCNKLFIYPESATTRIVGQETKMFLPPESGLPRKGSLARFRNPAKGSFPRFRIATEHSFLQSQDCNKITYSSSVRIATKGVFGQIQETSKGLVPQIRDCNAVGIPPESGLQQNTYSSRVRVATKGSLAVFRNPAKGSFSILEGATI